MFRRDKNSKMDNEGLRRMREAIRQRLEQDETAPGAASGQSGQADYRPDAPAGQGAYTYENLPNESGYSFLADPPQESSGEATSSPPASGGQPGEQAWQGSDASAAPGTPAAASAPTGPAVTTVAADATWSGTLRSTADVRVEGTLDGEVEAAGMLYVAPDARVEATARANTMKVAGQLNGQVECRERLEILPTGRVSGQIQAGAIVVHEGASIGGQLRMQGQDADDATGDTGQRPMLQRVR